MAVVSDAPLKCEWQTVNEKHDCRLYITQIRYASIEVITEKTNCEIGITDYNLRIAYWSNVIMHGFFRLLNALQ